MEFIGQEYGLIVERLPGVKGAPRWLKTAQTLHEQGATDDDTLIMKKRFFVSDDLVGKDDPVALQMIYAQVRQRHL